MHRLIPSAARSIVLLLAFSAAGCQGTTGTATRAAAQSATPFCEVYFSPGGGCTEVLLDAIEEAKHSIRVQAYSFTSIPIAQALVQARNRGVHVDVILDKSQLSERYSAAGILIQAGIQVQIDKAHAIAHNKVMIFDDAAVATGSFNFTKSAEERNAENLLLIRDTAVAAQYTTNWYKHRQHARPYAMPGE